MKKRFSCISFLFLLSSTFCFSQSKTIDSLTLLVKNTQVDTNKINYLLALALELEFENRERAQKLVQDALSLSKQLDYVKGEVKGLTYLGYLEQDIGNLEKGISFHKQALKIATDNDYKPGISLGIGNIGSIYHEQCNYPQALAFYYKSLKLDEELGDKAAISTDLGNIGLLYYYLGELEKAKEYYLKASDIATALGDKDEIARHTGNLASLYHQELQFQKALDLYLKALKINEEMKNNNQISAMLGNIGQIYFDLAKSENQTGEKFDSLTTMALDYHYKALRIKEEIEDKRGVAINEGNIGAILLSKKQYKQSEEFLLKSVLLAKENDALDIMVDVEAMLSDLYQQTNRYSQSLEHYKNYTLYKDSIFNMEKEKELTRYEMNYEFEKKEARIKAEQDKKDAVAETEKKRQNIFFWLISFVALSVGIIAAIVFRSLHITRKQKEIIEEQKELVVEKQKEILDSIYYARRIQRSLLPTEKYIQKSIYRLRKL